MTAPRKGQRIRAVIEGTAHFIGLDSSFVVLRDSGSRAVVPGDAPWGALPDPAPVWRRGDYVVIVDYNGSLYHTAIRGLTDWAVSSFTKRQTDDWINARSPRRLVVKP
jgi:hypothetical protein